MSASAGRVLIKPKGVYNQAIAYKKQDSVFFNGSSYICINDTLGHAPTDSEYWQIMAQGAGVISGAFSGACDSLGSAQVKSVIIPPADNFALQKGVIVGVRFTNTNTYEATLENIIALNVNNTGALPIYFGGTATPLGDNVVAFGEAAYTHFYQYDGTNWVFIGRSGVQTAEQTPYDSTKSTKTAIDEAQDLADTNEANIEAIVNVYSSKNLNSYPYYETTKAQNGITFTDNGDGTITATGTATGYAELGMHVRVSTYANGCYLKNGTYKVTGCPSGGSSTTYGLYVAIRNPNGGSQQIIANDYGEGATFEINGSYNDSDGAWIDFGFAVRSGTVISSGITAKPMIRDARISDPTHVPFAMTNEELTKNKVDKGGIVQYLSTGAKTISATGDGIKTLATLMTECRLAFINYISAQSSDYRFKLLRVRVNNPISLNLFSTDYEIRDNSYNGNPAFTRIDFVSNKLEISKIDVKSSSSTLFQSLDGTVSDLSSTVISSGQTVSIIFEEFRLV